MTSKDLGGYQRDGGSMPVCDEHMLQYACPGQSGECELVIGLDFGTSASKVVIQAPDLPGHPAYAVDFGELSPKSMPYLSPTRIWVAPNGACTLEPRKGTRLVNDIKLELFSKEEYLNSNRGPTKQELRPEETAAVYLAFLLRYARKWFLETKRDLVRHFKRLRWSVNLGVPSPCIEDNEENRRFRRVGRAGWMLSTLGGERVTLKKASVELNWVDDPEYWNIDNKFACDFDIIPEIAAGAVGYALSELRREGLHVMVDIGASTVDVCSFILHACEGSDRYSLLTADVQLLGTISLHHERILALKRVYEKQANDLRDKHDPLAPIAHDIEPYLVSREQLTSGFTQAEAQFKKRFQKMLQRVIWEAKIHRDPKASVWRNGRLPILLIGGGSKLQFFHSAVEELDAWLRRYARNNGAIFLPIPVPESLANKTDEYHRLAVAWGLSHRAVDIGEITPADRIPDIEPPRRLDWESRYISKDQV